MDNDIVMTIVVPLCIVGVSLLAMVIMAKVKKWRKRRTIERGVTEFLRQTKGPPSRGAHSIFESKSTAVNPRVTALNKRRLDTR
jgi:hypothetical protein